MHQLNLYFQKEGAALLASNEQGEMKLYTGATQTDNNGTIIRAPKVALLKALSELDVNVILQEETTTIKDKAKIEKIIKARQEKMKKAEKVFNETFQIANTEKASNGMTYVEARSIYNRIRRQWSEGMHDMHSLTDEQIINLIKKYIDNPPYGMTSKTVKYYRDMLNAFTTSIAAKSELEQNFENLAKIDDLYLQSKGRDIWVLKEDADYIKTFRLWG